MRIREVWILDFKGELPRVLCASGFCVKGIAWRENNLKKFRSGVLPTKPYPKETCPSAAVKTALEAGRSGFRFWVFFILLLSSVWKNRFFFSVTLI